MAKLRKSRWRYFRAPRIVAPANRAPLAISETEAVPVLLKYLHRRRGDFVSCADVLRTLAKHFACQPRDVRPHYDAIVNAALLQDAALQRRATGVRWAPHKVITLTYLLERLERSRIAITGAMPAKRWAQVLACWPEDIAYATDFFVPVGTGLALKRELTPEIVARVLDAPRSGGDVLWWVRRTACDPYQISRAIAAGWLVPTVEPTRFVVAPHLVPAPIALPADAAPPLSPQRTVNLKWLLAIAQRAPRHDDATRADAARAWLDRNVVHWLDPQMRAHFLDVGAYLENPAKTLRPILTHPLHGEIATPAAVPKPRGANPQWLLAISARMVRHADAARADAARAWLEANMQALPDPALRAQLIDVGAYLENPAKTLRAILRAPLQGELPPYAAPRAWPATLDATAQRLLDKTPFAGLKAKAPAVAVHMRAWLEHNITGAFENLDLRTALIARYTLVDHKRVRALRAPLRVYPEWRSPALTHAAYLEELETRVALQGATWRQHLTSTPEIDAWIRDALTAAVAAVVTDAAIVAPYVACYFRSLEPTPYAIHHATRWIWQACRTSPWAPYVGPLADVAAFARCATLRAGRLVTPDEAPAIAQIAWEPRRGFQWAAKLRDAPALPEFDAWMTDTLKPRSPQ